MRLQECLNGNLLGLQCAMHPTQELCDQLGSWSLPRGGGGVAIDRNGDSPSRGTQGPPAYCGNSAIQAIFEELCAG